MTAEKTVLVSPREGIFRTICEVEDTPDPEVKTFRFKEWPGKWPNSNSYPSGMKDDGSGPLGRLRYIHVYSYWGEGLLDVPIAESRYRVTAELDTPPGYVATYEGTTKPAPKAVEPVPVPDNDAERTRLATIEDSIIAALEKHGRMALSALKRKTNSYRFGDDWDKCLRKLAEQCELEMQTDEAKRVWVCITTVIT